MVWGMTIERLSTGHFNRTDGRSDSVRARN
jgi:hypothetical protein